MTGVCRRYDVRYVRRTGDRPDGCLTFWRRGAFREVTAEAVRLRDLGLRDNVALLVLLEPTPQGARSGGASGGPTEARKHPDASNGEAAKGAAEAFPAGSCRSDTGAAGAGEGACGSAANGDMQDAALAQPLYGQCSDKAGGAAGDLAAAGQLAEGHGGGGAPQAPLLLVGNTHLLFNPRRGDIKVATPAASYPVVLGGLLAMTTDCLCSPSLFCAGCDGRLL